MHVKCYCFIDKYYNAPSLGETPYRCRFRGLDVYSVRIDCTLPESLREKQLSEYKVGALPDESRRYISSQGE